MNDGSAASSRGRLAGVVIALILLELVLSGQLSIFGATPHFLFAATCCLAYCLGPSRGAVSGFACGLACDLLGSGAVGVSALALSIVGYALGSLLERRSEFGGAGSAVALGLAALFYNVACLVMTLILGASLQPASSVASGIILSSVLDFAVALLSLWVLARLLSRRGRLSSDLR